MKICKEIRDDERAYYGTNNTDFVSIKIQGPADGESAFKECNNITVKKTLLGLRYPFWHDSNLVVDSSRFLKTSRAPFWYSKDVVIRNCKCKGVKAIRECKNVLIEKSYFDSTEFGWQTNDIVVLDSCVISQYAFMHSNNVELVNVQFKGKYSFQYVNHLRIKDSILDTKDAFWHAKDVIVDNCEVIGEYLGWYAENVRFINCRIKGTQPLCYSKNIYFENCTFEDCDLAFEYSEVNGNIKGTMISIKNPLKGHITIDQIPEMICDNNNRSNGEFLIEKR